MLDKILNQTMFKRVFDLQMFADDGEPNGDGKDGGSEPNGDGKDGGSEPNGDGKDGGSEPNGKTGDDKKPAETEPKSEPKYTDADVDKLLERKFAEWEKKKQKEVDEAKKLAEMSAAEKAEYERDKLQKELDELKEKDSLSEMTKTARSILSDEGINAPDEVLSMLVSTDAEQTKSAISAFAKAFNSAVDAAVKAKLKGEPPKRGSGSGTAPMTKAEIMAIKDSNLRQEKMLEHRELFNY